MRFPITDLLSKQECYDFLLHTLHPDGMKCPNGHPLPKNQAPHDVKRAPVVDYRCRTCGCIQPFHWNSLVWNSLRLCLHHSGDAWGFTRCPNYATSR
jgi:hypothetical protein